MKDRFATVLVILFVLTLMFGTLYLNTITNEQDEKFEEMRLELEADIQAVNDKNASLKEELTTYKIRQERVINLLYAKIEKVNVKLSDIPEVDFKSVIQGIYKDIGFIMRELGFQ